jgi:hypothetical protein
MKASALMLYLKSRKIDLSIIMAIPNAEAKRMTYINSPPSTNDFANPLISYSSKNRVS